VSLGAGGQRTRSNSEIAQQWHGQQGLSTVAWFDSDLSHIAYGADRRLVSRRTRLVGTQSYLGLQHVANLAPGVSFWDRRLRIPVDSDAILHCQRDRAALPQTRHRQRPLLFWWIRGGFIVFLGFVVSL